jgi:hypothetical protein
MGLRSATSLQELAVGPTQLGLLDGLMIENSGPVAVRVSHSPSRVKEKVRVTSGTYGLTYFGSPVPDGPLYSWESRLRERLATHG